MSYIDFSHSKTHGAELISTKGNAAKFLLKRSGGGFFNALPDWL